MNKYEKNVSPETVFYVSNGKILNNIKELYHEINQMPDDVFFHHVNADKNDFSNWVREVMGEKALAAKMAKAATPVMMKEVLKGLFEAEIKPVKAVTKNNETVKKAAAAKKSPAKSAGSKKA